MFLPWTPQLSVGVAMIDDEHKKLFAIANDLHDAMTKREAAGKVGKVLDELANYTRTHFGHEEAEMAKHKYPGLAVQRQQHAEFLKRVGELQASFRKNPGAQVLTLDVWDFLSKWLTGHIKVLDKQLGTWLVQQGLAA